ncbi:NACHT domain-containing protein [Ancylothrix sp. C2]|uniref:NACHT C-terminal alpha/beta 1 domain-containing protein n=1 Tax=Ancylothrix sp. D3o TaxID=2953691 RepID=UPI0021BAA055|nr:NACHT domain-containing protein [Ancylothrix sp. D3o]MCT7952919.1 NACHT domain-containing protein [Ancylothrix sp. D3o]
MPSKDKVTYGPTVKKRAKRLLEALLAYVNGDLEDISGISLSYKWQDETTKQPKLVIETKLRVLEYLTEKDRHEGKLTKTQIRQALNEHLKEFLQILEDTRAKTQGEEDWHFTLKLWSKDKEKNLEQFEIEWEDKRPEKSKQQEETLRETVVETFQATSPLKDEGINWQGICRQNLALQKQLTTNPFTNAYGVTPQLDEIYVRLAIVERKPPKPPSRNQPEEKEEELIPIAEERFFEDVLRQGKSQSQGRKIAIIGEPGSGKTTRLQKIAGRILEKDLGLPIWIDLADLENKNICKYLENEWLPKCKGGVKRSDLEPQISRAWLLLDGVDEMSHPHRMKELSEDLSSSWLQDARVVVTCRVNVWEADKNAFSGFDVFRNLPFNPEQVTDYIRRWFAAMGDAATGESLEAALAQSGNSRLKELIQNPLLLWMLCQIWQTGGGLPKTQAGLYAQFVDWVYRWKADEEILDQREAMNKALARLALAAMEQKDEVSRLRLRESWVLKVLGSRPIFQAVMKLGWLNRVERFPEAICVFYHATFQEYFAALVVDDWDYFLPRNHVNFPVAGKEYRIFEPQWKQLILLWLGRNVGEEKKKEFIEKLMNFEDGCGDFYKCRAYFLTATTINEYKTCSLASEIVKQVVQWGFVYFGEPIGKWARKVIPEINRQLVITELYEIVKNCKVGITCFGVAHWLGEIGQGNLQAIEALTTLLETSNNISTCLQAAGSLLKIDPGNTKALTALIKFLKPTNPKNIRWQAAESLGEIYPINPEVIPALKEILKPTEDEYTRLVGAENLLKIDPRNPEAIETLNILQENAKNTYVGLRPAEILLKNGQENPQAIKAFNTFQKTTIHENIHSLEEKSIGQIDFKKTHKIADLIRDIETAEDKYISWAAESLEEILTTPEQYADAVSILKKYLSDKTYQYGSRRVKEWYKVLWCCAHKLPYSNFYREWHSDTPTSEPINLTQLPPLLQALLTETNLHQTFQLLCIDGSKFDNRDNPAVDIYLQLVKKHNCPKSTEGTPRTLTELKIYWQLLDWEKQPILIFYEETNPQGFRPTFLDALTRFDATICVITGTPHPTIPTFLPEDPQLIQTIINWLQSRLLEA